MHPEGDLHSAGALQCPPTILFIYYWLCSELLHYLFTFPLNHGNSDPVTLHLASIQSNEGFLYRIQIMKLLLAQTTEKSSMIWPESIMKAADWQEDSSSLDVSKRTVFHIQTFISWND